MNSRITVKFDGAIRPEWIDFALERYLHSTSEAQLRNTLKEFLQPFGNDPVTIQKTVLQLQRTVGYRSRISRSELEALYVQLADLKPEARNPVRLQILCESNNFFLDCVEALRKLRMAGTEEVSLQHLYARIDAIYGEREMVHRRVRYVIQTLAAFGCVTNTKGKWRIEDSLNREV